MSSSTAKKFRKQYRKAINDLTKADLKKEIFRLARNRDILGIVLIIENILLLIACFYFIRYFI